MSDQYQALTLVTIKSYKAIPELKFKIPCQMIISNAEELSILLDLCHIAT